MRILLLFFTMVLMSACNYTPSLKLTVSNSSQRNIPEMKIGHNNGSEAVVISNLAPGKDTNVILTFKTAAKENGKYWITTSDGFIDSFGFYKGGLPVHIWVGIEHRGDDIKVSLQ